MKKTILLTILILLLNNCGTRKKTSELDKSIQKDNTEVKSETKTDTSSEKQSEKNETSSHKLNSDILNFSVKSPDGLPVFFNFSNGLQNFKGETNGEINFSNEKKQEEKTSSKHEKIIEKIHTTYYSHTTYKTQTNYKTIQKNKTSESKRPSLAWYVLAFFLGMIFIPGLKLIFKR